MTLAGSEWQPRSIANQNAASLDQLFVRFEAEGRIVAHSACSAYRANFAIDGDNITIGPFIRDPGQRSDSGCHDTAQSSETAFLSALARATRFARDRIHLTLFDSEGGAVLELRQTDWD